MRNLKSTLFFIVVGLAGACSSSDDPAPSTATGTDTNAPDTASADDTATAADTASADDVSSEADTQSESDAGEQDTNTEPAPLLESYEYEATDAWPEGVTFDPVGRRFYTASLEIGNVMEIDADGTEREFFAGNEDGQQWLGLGVEVDAERRRLWVCMGFTTALTASEIWVLDLDTGERLWQQPLDEAFEGAACTDMIIADNGHAYVCDRENPNIYLLDPDAKTAEIFVTDERLAGTIGQNGIAFTPEGDALLTIIFAPGTLMRIPLDDPESLAEVPMSGVETLFGLDGLTVLDGKAYIVRDDTIIQATPNSDWTAVATSELPLPSTGFSGVTVAEGALYASRSHVTRFALQIPIDSPFLLHRVEITDF